MAGEHEEWIDASEFGSFLYDRRTWLNGRTSERGARMLRGREHHRRRNDLLRRTVVDVRRARRIDTLTLLSFLTALFFYLLSQEGWSRSMTLVLQIVSLLLLLHAAYQFSRSVRLRRSAQRDQQAAGFEPGDLVYSDLPFVDDESCLSGKPDYVVFQRGNYVPVDIKSGAAPLQIPHAHELQLAAYARLLAATYGERPILGILEYEDAKRTIALDAALDDQLQLRLDEMRREIAAERAASSARRDRWG